MPNNPSAQNQTHWPADWFEHIDVCILCGGKDCPPFLDKVQDWFFKAVPGEFSFGKCSDCASLILLNRPNVDHIGAAYSSYYTHVEAKDLPAARGLLQVMGRRLSSAYSAVRYQRKGGFIAKIFAETFALFPVRREEVNAAYRYLPKEPSTVLDFGCGNGAFLDQAKALGHKAIGVDFDENALKAGRKRGLELLLPQEIDEKQFHNRFDHITLNHVIEHVSDPVALLADCRKWLKPGGSLFLEVPHAKAAGLAKFGRFWRGLEAPRHFSIPSKQGLQMALETAGFSAELIGVRAFAASHMDEVSSLADTANPNIVSGPLSPSEYAGAEILTCVARPN